MRILIEHILGIELAFNVVVGYKLLSANEIHSVSPQVSGGGSIIFLLSEISNKKPLHCQLPSE